MRTLESFSDETWDRFFDFIADGVADKTDAEVKADLEAAGIDTTAAIKRVAEMVRKYRKQESLMDSKGYWHNERPSEQMEALTDELQGKEHRPRFVIELAVDELVRVVTADGSYTSVVFKKAEKNKVTFVPPSDSPVPYFDFASTVTIERATGESVKAQVWDNRNGTLILRTLPV
jgi:hypothetical protein